MNPYQELTLYQRSAVLMAAAKLGVFTAIANEGLTPSEVAKCISAPADTVGRLLNALASLDYIAKDGARFSLNDFSRAFLHDGAGGMARLVWKEHLFYTAWSRLDQAVATGEALFPSFAERMASDFSSVEKFLLALNDLAETGAPGVIATGAFANAKTILDLGGGGGGYAAALATAFPDAKVTLADLQEIIPIAQRYLAQKKLDDRVDVITANFLKEGCGIGGRSFERVFLSHILHDFDPQTASAIVARGAGLVRNPGKLVILDVFVPDEGPRDPVEALFDLMMLVEVPHARTHRDSDARAWLDSAGMGSVKSHKLFFGTLLEASAP